MNRQSRDPGKKEQGKNLRNLANKKETLITKKTR